MVATSRRSRPSRSQTQSTLQTAVGSLSCQTNKTRLVTRSRSKRRTNKRIHGGWLLSKQPGAAQAKSVPAPAVPAPAVPAPAVPAPAVPAPDVPPVPNPAQVPVPDNSWWKWLTTPSKGGQAQAGGRGRQRQQRRRTK